MPGPSVEGIERAEPTTDASDARLSVWILSVSGPGLSGVGHCPDEGIVLRVDVHVNP
jgi:hypothetical protein